MEHWLPCARNRPATHGRCATQIASDVAHSTWQCSELASSPVAAASCVIQYASEFPVPGLPWDGSAGLAVEVPAGDFFVASFGDPAACSLLLDTKEGWSFFNSATMAGSSGISDANSARRCAERPCSPVLVQRFLYPHRVERAAGKALCIASTTITATRSLDVHLQVSPQFFVLSHESVFSLLRRLTLTDRQNRNEFRFF